MKDVWKEIIPIYYSENMESTKKFYSELLEFEIYKEQKNLIVFSIKAGCKIGFTPQSDIACTERNSRILIYVTDIDAVYAHITSSGYDIPPLPHAGEDNGGDLFTVKDPNDYTLEFREE